MTIQLNKVYIAGNLTRDPETRQTGNGTTIANFGLAANRSYGKGEDRKEETTFVEVTAFGRTAELVAQYLSKGSACLVEGRLTYDEWEAQDGTKRNKLKITADNVQFLASSGKRGGEQQHSRQSRTPAPIPAPTGGMDDDPPF